MGPVSLRWKFYYFSSSACWIHKQSSHQWQIRWGQAQHNLETWGHHKAYTLLWGIPIVLGAEQDSARNIRQSLCSWQESVLYIHRYRHSIAMFILKRGFRIFPVTAASALATIRHQNNPQNPWKIQKLNKESNISNAKKHFFYLWMFSTENNVASCLKDEKSSYTDIYDHAFFLHFLSICK